MRGARGLAGAALALGLGGALLVALRDGADGRRPTAAEAAQEPRGPGDADAPPDLAGTGRASDATRAPAPTVPPEPDADAPSPAGTVLAARVSDPGGAPLAGVRVEPAGGPPFAPLATDADGRFAAPGLPPLASCTVRLEHPGFFPAEAALVAGIEGDLVLRPAVPLAGRVLAASDRHPLAGVEVALVASRSAPPRATRATTDADGRFRIAAAPAGTQARLRLRPPAALALERSVRVGDEPLEDLELLVAEDGALALALVELESGAPLPGLEVSLGDGGRLVADGEGLVRVAFAQANRPDQADGAFTVTLHAEGWCRTSVRVPWSERAGAHTVPLTRGARLEGVVVDEAGVPLAGVRVSARQREQAAVDGARLETSLRPGSEEPGTTTGDDGTFVLRSLPPATTFALSARADAGSPELVVPERACRTPETGAALWIELAAARAAAVRGRVLAGTAPFPCEVTVAPQAGGRVRARTRTDSRGRFWLRGLEPGPARLAARIVEEEVQIRSGDDALAGANVELRAGETLERDLLVERPPARLAGTVRGAGGEPRRGVLVFARDPGEASLVLGPEGAMRNVGANVRTGVAGRFELFVPQGAEPIEVVALEAATEASALVPPEGDGAIELVLPAPGTLVLDVRDPESGERVRSLRLVSWWPASAPRSSLPAGTRGLFAAGAEGTFRLPLPEGAWQLELLADGYAPTVVDGARVVAGEERLEPLALDPGTRVVLRVVTPDGPLPAGTTVTLFSADELAREGDLAIGLFRPSFASSRCGEGGEVVLPHVAPGRYPLARAFPGWEVEPAVIDVPAAGRHEVEVILREPRR